MQQLFSKGGHDISIGFPDDARLHWAIAGALPELVVDGSKDVTAPGTTVAGWHCEVAEGQVVDMELSIGWLVGCLGARHLRPA